MSDQDLRDLRARNLARAQEAKEKMGERWALHPKNQQTKKKYRKEVRAARKVYS